MSSHWEPNHYVKFGSLYDKYAVIHANDDETLDSVLRDNMITMYGYRYGEKVSELRRFWQSVHDGARKFGGLVVVDWLRGSRERGSTSGTGGFGNGVGELLPDNVAMSVVPSFNNNSNNTNFYVSELEKLQLVGQDFDFFDFNFDYPNMILNQQVVLGAEENNVDANNNNNINNNNNNNNNQNVVGQEQPMVALGTRWTVHEMETLHGLVLSYGDNSIDWTAIEGALRRSARLCKVKYYSLVKEQWGPFAGMRVGMERKTRGRGRGRAVAGHH